MMCQFEEEILTCSEMIIGTSKQGEKSEVDQSHNSIQQEINEKMVLEAPSSFPSKSSNI